MLDHPLRLYLVKRKKKGIKEDAVLLVLSRKLVCQDDDDLQLISTQKHSEYDAHMLN